MLSYYPTMLKESPTRLSEGHTKLSQRVLICYQRILLCSQRSLSCPPGPPRVLPCHQRALPCSALRGPYHNIIILSEGPTKLSASRKDPPIALRRPYQSNMFKESPTMHSDIPIMLTSHRGFYHLIRGSYHVTECPMIVLSLDHSLRGP